MKRGIPTKTVFPVGLLADERPCLVVGAGTVATRKVAGLLDAGANVVVVAPETTDEIRGLAEAGRIRLVSRDFQPGDADGTFIAFAATDDKSVNGAVLEACRERNVLCCRVDGSWVESDFVTPATFRNGDLTVSVSTGGRSCRHSRLVKDNLVRHVEMVETADLIVMGTSHRILSLAEREPYHLAGEKMHRVAGMITEVWGVHEFMILNTCNRVELIATVSRKAGTSGLLRRILSFDHLERGDYYVHRGRDAFEHMALVAAGLLSQSPGENHIVAQIKDALALAVKEGWGAGMMNEWIAAALRISRDIRRKTAPMLRNFEIEDLCMDYLKCELPDMTGVRFMVLGTGVEGTGLVRRIAGLNLECDWCYHVNQPVLPDDWADRVNLCTFNDLRDRLPDVQVIVCATASPSHVLRVAHAPFLDLENDVLIVDLAIPRNVEPGLADVVANLRIADLDDLKHWFRREAADMEAILESGRRIIEDHTDLYEKIIRSFQGGNASE
jgi:glutamyl-tRNA reductase